MATMDSIILSGSTSGKGILVAATATLGTTIHTAVAGSTSLDEIWLWCVNTDPASIKLTIEYGGAASSVGNAIEVTIPGEVGLIAVVPGLKLNGGLVVTAFAGSANLLAIHGFVNRKTP